MPTIFPNLFHFSLVASAIISGARKQNSINTPVFSSHINSISLSLASLDSYSISRACPKIIPLLPIVSRSIFASKLFCFSVKYWLSNSISNAIDCIASPAKTAVASLYFLCSEGCPLLKSSSSMHGRSSCTRE